jgi:hypothetical protein
MLEPSKTIPSGLPLMENVAAVFAPYHRNSAKRFAFGIVADKQVAVALPGTACENPQTGKNAMNSTKTLLITLSIVFASCELVSSLLPVRLAHWPPICASHAGSNSVPCSAQPNAPQLSFGMST